ncbi:MAG: SDR family NAD(P)-dependent oxidoreductase [Nitrospinota bacterium]
MDLGLEGRVAMITGASRGLGKASALALAAEGCHISTMARGAEDLEKARREIETLGVKALTLQGDASRGDDTARFFDRTLETFERVDILINNIGGSSPGGNIDADDDMWHLAFENNFFSAVRLTRLVLPEMQRRGFGRVINISSIFGREWGGNATYMSSKAALIALTKQIARSVTDDRVTVNSVAPGSIMFEGGSWWRRRQEDPEKIDAFIRAEMPFGRMGRPEEIGSVVAFLASERASLVNGVCFNVDGGQSRSLI